MNAPLLRCVLTTVVLTLLAAGALRGATIEDLAASLRVEVDKTIAESKTAKTGSSSGSYENERLIARLETALAKDNYEEADQTLTQLAVARLSVQAKELIHQLQREVPRAAEERQKAFVSQVGTALGKAGKACLNAKAENDLDPVFAELSALRQRRSEGSTSEQRTRLNNRLEGAIRFVNRWQDYLVQSAHGYEGTARNILRELADPANSFSGNQYYPLIARPELVARLGKETDTGPEEVLRGIKKLDDLPKAIADLSRINQESGSRRSNPFELTAPLNELNQIYKAHAAFKAGAYGAALQVAAQAETGAAGTWSVETIRLKTLLLMEVLPRYLELPVNPQPKEGENPSEFLLRLAREGAAASDWAQVARALDTYRLTAFGTRQPPGWISDEVEACVAFGAAANLEKAGRFAPAVIAYQRVLQHGGKYGPQKASADRLAALEKEQPAAFAEATREAQLREILETIRPVAPAAGFR